MIRDFHKTQSRFSSVVADEQGAFVLLLAVFAMLLLIVSLGFSVDLPIVRTVAVEVQAGLDQGSREGIRAIFLGHQKATDIAFDLASVWLEPGSGTAGIASFADTFGGGANCSLVSPRFRTQLYTSARCAGNPPTDFRNLFDQSWNDVQVDDFRNMIGFYGRFTPKSTLLSLSNPDVQSVALYRLKPTLSYFLFAPLISLNDPPPSLGGRGNYDYVFGTDERADTPTTDMWPYYASIVAGAQHDTWGDFPIAAGQFSRNPLTGSAFPATYQQPLSGNAQDTASRRIRRFFTALCDSGAWAYYKKAGVDLVDKLVTSSAFNTTALVGLPGYHENEPLVPIFPADVSTELSVASSSGVTMNHFAIRGGRSMERYPLRDPARNNPLSSTFLHMAQRNSFSGFVNTVDGRYNANFGYDGRAPYDDADGKDNYGSGINDWSLCYCSELYKSGQGFQLHSDQSFEGDIDAELLLRHEIDAKRAAAPWAVNWCDSNPISGSPSDLIVDWQNRRNADQHGIGVGETVRNIISNLAIRLEDNFIDRTYLSTPGSGASFARPQAAADVLNANPKQFLVPGRYNIGKSLFAASDVLVRAHMEYGDMSSPTNAWRRLRPADDSPMVVVMAPAIGDSRLDRSQLLSDFEFALAKTVCSNNQRVFFAFLPLDDHDLVLVHQAQEIIRQYQENHDWFQAGGDPTLGAPPNALPTCPSDAIAMQRPELLVVDFRDFIGGGAVNIARARISAARFYSSNIVHRIMTELMKLEYVS